MIKSRSVKRQAFRLKVKGLSKLCSLWQKPPRISEASRKSSILLVKHLITDFDSQKHGEGSGGRLACEWNIVETTLGQNNKQNIKRNKNILKCSKIFLSCTNISHNIRVQFLLKPIWHCCAFDICLEIYPSLIPPCMISLSKSKVLLKAWLDRAFSLVTMVSLWFIFFQSKFCRMCSVLCWWGGGDEKCCWSSVRLWHQCHNIDL